MKKRDFFYRDDNGKMKDDNIHSPILNNKKARTEDSKSSIEKAIASGVSRRDAEQAFKTH